MAHEEQHSSTRLIEKNISKLHEVKKRHEANAGVQGQLAEYITRFAGSMACVYFHLTLFGLWLLINSKALPIVKPFDPYPFVMLAMFASVEAIFLSTFVLIGQNRSNEMAEKRADLDLQVSLLSEHELTRLLQIVDRLAAKLGVAIDDLDDLPGLKKDVHAEIVLDKIEEAKV